MASTYVLTIDGKLCVCMGAWLIQRRKPISVPSSKLQENHPFWDLESPKCIILESGAAIDARRIHWFLSRVSSDSAGTPAGSWILEDLGGRMTSDPHLPRDLFIQILYKNESVHSKSSRWISNELVCEVSFNVALL